MADARYHDLEQSSSDSSDAEPFLISSIRGHVGAPPPKLLPIKNVHNSACDAVYSLFGPVPNPNSVRHWVENIAREQGVEIVDVNVVVRLPVEGSFVPEADEYPPTILILANWAGEESYASWEKVVTNTKKFFDQMIISAGDLLEVKVEMIDLESTLRRYISPTEYSDALDRDWTVIKGKTRKILDSYPTTKSRVYLLALFKLGTDKHADNNPPTVFISVDYESEESKWPPIVDEIQQHVDGYPYKFRVHIEHSSGDSWGNGFD